MRRESDFANNFRIAPSPKHVSFVLVVRRHFVAVGGGEIADSGWMYDRRPQPVATAPHRRVLVRQTIACRPDAAA